MLSVWFLGTLKVSKNQRLNINIDEPRYAGADFGYLIKCR